MRSFVLVLTVVAAYFLLRGSPEGWHVILRVSIAVFVLVFGLAIWGKRRPTKSTIATPERAPRWLDFLSMGLAILVIEALFLLFFASAPEAAEDLAREFDERLHPAAYQSNSPSGDGPQKTGPLQTSGNWLWKNNGRRELGGSGKVRPSNRPEVYLWPDDARLFRSGEIYLRTFTLSAYQDGVWSALPEAPKSFPSENGVVNIAPTPPRTLAYEIYHGPNTLGQSLAVTLPNLIEVETTSLRRIAPDTYRLPSLPADSSAYRYRARSAPRFFTADLLPAKGDLAPSADPIIIELAASTSGTPGQRLTQIRDLLAERCQYSLDPKLDEGKDPLVEFLVTKRRGFCEHFATAAALLAREIGYASRVAYGWSGGRYYEAPNMFVFRAKEAHAWAEVQVESGEWVIFEATPPDRSEGNSTIAGNNEIPQVPDGLDLGLGDLNSADSSLPPLAPLRNFAALIGGAGILAFFLSLFLKRPEKKDANHRPGAGLLPTPLNYLVAFRRASATLGFPMPPGRTLRQQLAALRAEDQLPEIGDELLSYHYQITYGGKPRAKATEKRFLSLLKQWGRKN
ncbi:hypothetical protein N9982_01980 [Akkermansiaceae bacterium]|nr:hypothetical protein [Akkermansiaceae bacterium]